MSQSPKPDSGGAARMLCCPQCQGNIYRVPRRLRDIWFSAVVPLRRYACRSLQCGWEGNLRRSLARQDGGQADDQRSFML
ncbi:hypothetical protein OOZ63_05295 [Paucibacter sp. PLA-PC-4]|uniref:hypothetical protein n=1 Tax=Paucibacter sp. PLA-PC-4 TaxID=2993655 RepID=UPI002249744A|nr:hypothetical protein [Paucibacter sp. PLA-PC-4]MCX2861252.1 hypothetical protein [Paucibacter sp. PLA-PC-4]